MQKTTFRMTETDMEEFRYYLQERENSTATIGKYLHDVRTFKDFLGEENSADKEKLLEYKEWLLDHYAVSSVNSMLVALNQYLVFRELGRLRLKRVKVQRADLMGEGKMLTKEEFRRLVRTARAEGKGQIAMIMETMCATGIRVSELRFFRAKNVRSGMVKVWNKGKYRMVILPEVLKQKLFIYISKNQIKAGPIFCTRTGREKNRSNIWKEMKSVADAAGVSVKKVFPHNLRHLFARTFYRETKNLVILADILGHSSLQVTKTYAADGIKEWKKSLEKIELLELAT